MSKATFQRVKGMYDALPADSARFRRIEDTASAVFQSYVFGELRIPLVERAALFSGAIGTSSDIVGKEMYVFSDRKGEDLALRPEATAGVVRAVLENGLLQSLPRKLWYTGPMFRHENVQAGRSRQFHQIGAEVFGVEEPAADAELLAICSRIWRELGIKGLELELNSLGSQKARASHREALVSYLQDRRAALDEDSQRRLTSNPLRILDSKNEAMSDIVANAPTLDSFYSSDDLEHFQQLQSLLATLEIPFRHNPRLVRGLDYYSRTVFEWTSNRLGAQATVCGGGRYDGLVAAQGGPATPAVGFSLGMERVGMLMAESEARTLLAYVVTGAGTEAAALRIAEQLRDEVVGAEIEVNLQGGSFKSQFRRADRSGALFAIVLGSEELASGDVTLKPLRGDSPQQRVSQSSLGRVLQTAQAAKETSRAESR